MKKKILIGCFEVPSHGGASTSSYILFEKMQKQGLDVSYVNIISDYDADYFRFIFNEKVGNPKGLDNVHNCFLSKPIFYPNPRHTELAELIDRLSSEIIVGIDFIATLILKRESANAPVIFLTCGCDQAGKYIEEKEINCAVDLNNIINKSDKNFLFRPRLYNSMETLAVEMSDLILTHSEMNKKFYNYFFPLHKGKIFPEVIWFADWIYEDAFNYSNSKIAFADRDIDIIFVSSLWERTVKNYPLMKRIILKSVNKNIHVVGEVQERIEGVNYHGFVKERELMFELLGRSKVVVSTSTLDTAPGLLYEASAMGCNIICSENCGNWQICNKNLLIEEFSVDSYMDRIDLALSGIYDDNINYFLAKNSFQNLLDILDVF